MATHTATASSDTVPEGFTIAGTAIPSRLVLGTGGMSSPESLREALVAA